MAHHVTLTSVAALVLVGTGVGAYLGKSAIASINPIYYSDPASTSFHADLVPNPPLRSTAQPELSGPQPLVVDCVGCRAYPEEYFPRHDAAVDQLDARWSPAPARASKTAEPLVFAEAPRDLEREHIDRYASFPVAAEAAEPEAEAATDQTGEEAALD